MQIGSFFKKLNTAPTVPQRANVGGGGTNNMLMIDFSNAQIEKMAVARVGKKRNYDGVSAPTVTTPNQVLEELLLGFFAKTFQTRADYFYFDTDAPVYETIRSKQQDLAELGNNLALQLYENSDYKNVNAGEFFTFKFNNIDFEGQLVEAIGVWKVNSKEYAIKSESQSAMFFVKEEMCISLKPSAMALVLLIEESEGYRVLALDMVSKKNERSFWMDAFLRLKPLEDEYFNTVRHIDCAANFLENKGLGLNKADIVDVKNRIALYFKEFEIYETKFFADRIFDEEIAEKFVEYRKEYGELYGIELQDRFTISTQAVKKEIGVLKNQIKLDKNFSLSLKSRRDLLERGFDEDKGMKFYKIYFENEE